MKKRVKYFLIFGIGLLLVGSIGMSYALFTANTEKKGVLNIVAGNVYCPLESTDLNENYQVTVSAWHEKVIHVTLRNASIVPVHSILAYVDNPNIKVYRELQSKDKIELEKLDVSGTRDYKIVLRNNSDTDQVITLKSKCGVVSKELTLAENEKEIKEDISIPNAPKLTDGLIPVKYDESKSSWIKTDTSNPLNNLWYDYDNFQWANAVTVVETSTSPDGHNRDYYQKAPVGEPISMDDINTMWVWIPRYEYRYDNLGNQYAGGTKEQPGEIVINFIEGTKDSFSDQDVYKLHPAFTFGEEELTGFWYGKFETSNKEEQYTQNDDTLTPIIKPNVISWRNINVSRAFYASRKMQTDNYNLYGFANDNTYDTHMSKNSEWGAVAYLSQSRYGKYGKDGREVVINSCNQFKTGVATCNDDYISEAGQKASTTGTIYGVYDMSGGAWDYTMGAYGIDKQILQDSGFTEDGDYPLPDKKYYDLYTTTNSTTACDGGICYGHAISETNAWYNDGANFLVSSHYWFERGGGFGNTYYAGVFYFNSYSGGVFNGNSFRIVLIP